MHLLTADASHIIWDTTSQTNVAPKTCIRNIYRGLVGQQSCSVPSNVDLGCRSRVSSASGLAMQLHRSWVLIPTGLDWGAVLCVIPQRVVSIRTSSLRGVVTGAGQLPLGVGRRQPTFTPQGCCVLRFVSCSHLSCWPGSQAGRMNCVHDRKRMGSHFADGSNILSAHSTLCGVQRLATKSHIPPNDCPDHDLPLTQIVVRAPVGARLLTTQE
jgi:hypothetical protein